MSNCIIIGGISFNILALDGISEAKFLETQKSHYRFIGNGKEDKMKADYKELKKHFTKKRREIRKAEDNV